MLGEFGLWFRVWGFGFSQGLSYLWLVGMGEWGTVIATIATILPFL